MPPATKNARISEFVHSEIGFPPPGIVGFCWLVENLLRVRYWSARASPNDLKLSDGGGLAARLLRKVCVVAAGMTGRSRSLQRMVRPLARFHSAFIDQEQIVAVIWDETNPMLFDGHPTLLLKSGQAVVIGPETARAILRPHKWLLAHGSAQPSDSRHQRRTAESPESKLSQTSEKRAEVDQ